MVIISANIYYPSTSFHLTTTSLVPATVLSELYHGNVLKLESPSTLETYSWLQTDD